MLDGGAGADTASYADSDAAVVVNLSGEFNAGTEFRVNTVTDDDQWYPSVTGLSDGGFVVTWGSYEGYDVYGQLYTADGTQAGPEFQVSTVWYIYVYPSSVTALSAGGFVVTWTNMELYHSNKRPTWVEEYNVYGQRFAADGPPWDPSSR